MNALDSMTTDERAQIERDLNLIEARRALYALLEDAIEGRWSMLDIHNLKLVIQTIERRS